MGKFYVDNGNQESIDEICWENVDGDLEGISLVNFRDDTLKFTDANDDQVCFYRKDIPKLLKALEKAKELGWWTDAPGDE